MTYLSGIGLKSAPLRSPTGARPFEIIGSEWRSIDGTPEQSLCSC